MRKDFYVFRNYCVQIYNYKMTYEIEAKLIFYKNEIGKFKSYIVSNDGILLSFYCFNTRIENV